MVLVGAMEKAANKALLLRNLADFLSIIRLKRFQ